MATEQEMDDRTRRSLEITHALYREFGRVMGGAESVSITAGVGGILGVLGAFLVNLNDSQPFPEEMAGKVKAQCRETLERALAVFDKYRGQPPKGT